MQGFKRGILYVPDYLANAGGLVNVSAELWPEGYLKTNVINVIEKLKKTLKKILTESDKTHTNPNIVADLLVEKFIHKSAA